MLNQIKTTPFEWIDIVNPTDEEMAQVSSKYHLHPAAVQDARQPGHLPKYELLEDDMHFIVCRYYDKDSPKNSDSIPEISRKMSIFFNKNVLITIHTKEVKQFDEAVQKYKDHPVPFEVVCKILKSLLSSYEDPVSKLDHDIDFYESRIFLKKKIPDLLKNLYLIKRRMYVIRKLFNLLEEIIEKLSVIHKRNAVEQDLKDYYVKLDTQIEEIYDSIQSLLGIYISLSSQRTNEVMRTLTVFTAFFLPLTFIVGVYGMNFKYMPELNEQFGYPVVMGVMLMITLGIYLWFKRKGWM